jgi:DNA-binding response OmpR family regulator
MAQETTTVDDSNKLRRLVKLSLNAAGYDVIEAVEVQAAPNITEGCAIHVIGTDLKIP